MQFKNSLFGLLSLSVLGLAACGVNEELRSEVAMRIASPAWMIERPVSDAPFIMAFERMHENNAPANIYIGGEGEADISNKLRFDPTPWNPVALHLASKDKALNLAYLGRPCQYADMEFYETMKSHVENCDPAEWDDAQFSPEIIATYHKILDGIKGRYHVTSFNLTGYSTGATIAAILAAQRQDVLSLRTVAGKFDTALLEPEMSTLRNVPQSHFIGGQDEVTPPQELYNYLQALGETDCAQHLLIQEATHEKGWVDKWPGLLKDNAPLCGSYISTTGIPDFEPLETPIPVYSPRMESDYK